MSRLGDHANGGNYNKDNLDKLPEVDQYLANKEAITIGDIHGNGVLMLYFLIKGGVIHNIDSDDYAEFVAAHTTIYRELVFKPFYDFVVSQSLPGHDMDKMLGVYEERLPYFLRLPMHEERGSLSHNEYVKRVRKFAYGFVDDSIIPKSYDLVVSYIKNNDEAKKALKAAFQSVERITGKIKVTDRNRVVRFGGDTLGDRGPCDYSILLLLDKLQENQKNVDVRILMSNHDAGFIANIPLIPEKLENPTASLSPGQEASLFSMLAALKEKLLDLDKVQAMIKKSYLPRLRLIDCSNDFERCSDQPVKKPPRFFTHAPAGDKQIESVFKYVLRDDESRQQIASLTSDKTREGKLPLFKLLVDKANASFQETLDHIFNLTGQNPNPSPNPNQVWLRYFGTTANPAERKLAGFVWTKLNELSQYPDWRTKYWGVELECFHGHHGDADVQVGNLNGNLGKALLDMALPDSIFIHFFQKFKKGTFSTGDEAAIKHWVLLDTLKNGPFWNTDGTVHYATSGNHLGSSLAQRSGESLFANTCLEDQEKTKISGNSAHDDDEVNAHSTAHQHNSQAFFVHEEQYVMQALGKILSLCEDSNQDELGALYENCKNKSLEAQFESIISSIKGSDHENLNKALTALSGMIKNKAGGAKERYDLERLGTLVLGQDAVAKSAEANKK